jgi:hypothetical protein
MNERGERSYICVANCPITYIECIHKVPHTFLDRARTPNCSIAPDERVQQARNADDMEIPQQARNVLRNVTTLITSARMLRLTCRLIQSTCGLAAADVNKNLDANESKTRDSKQTKTFSRFLRQKLQKKKKTIFGGKLG